MTRKDFVAAAKLVAAMHGKRQPSLLARMSAEDVCAVLVVFFQNDNPAFDAERFRKACGL